jgi:hypothetical protein
MTGLHSPFGITGNIKERTGYPHKYILWGQPWNLFLMEMADAPRYTDKPDARVAESAEEVAETLGGRIKVIE